MISAAPRVTALFHKRLKVPIHIARAMSTVEYFSSICHTVPSSDCEEFVAQESTKTCIISMTSTQAMHVVDEALESILVELELI